MRWDKPTRPLQDENDKEAQEHRLTGIMLPLVTVNKPLVDITWTIKKRNMQKTAARILRGGTSTEHEYEYVLPRNGLVRMEALMQAAAKKGQDGTEEEWIEILRNSARCWRSEMRPR